MTKSNENEIDVKRIYAEILIRYWIIEQIENAYKS